MTFGYFASHALPTIVGVIAAGVISWLIWKYITTRTE